MKLANRLFLQCLVILAALPVIVGAQQRGAPGAGGQPVPPPEETGAITGTVAKAGSGAPIRGATLTILRVASDTAFGGVAPGPATLGGLRGAAGRGVMTALGATGNGGTFSVSTDANGAYTLRGLAPGQYRVRAAAPGFISQGHGQQYFDQPGTPVTVAANSAVTVNFQLLANGYIEGRVLNPEGLPMPDCQVQTLAATFDAGPLTLVPYRSAQTNSAGEFRIADVEPGEYYVMASPPPALAILPPDTAVPQRATLGRGVVPGARGVRAGAGGRGATGATGTDQAPPKRAYAPTFYPNGVAVTDATMISMLPGQNVQAIVISLSVVNLSSISGALTAPATLFPPQQPPQQPDAGRGTALQGQGPGPAGAGAAAMQGAQARGRGAAPPVAGPRGRGAAAGVIARGAVAPARGRGPGSGGGATNPAAGVAIQFIPQGFSAESAAPGAPRGAAINGTGIIRATTGADGTFHVPNMLPGTYTVFASTRATNVPLTASGRLDVTNGADGNFTLALRQSVAVPGRLFVNTPPPENYRAETVQITLTPADNVPVASVVARAAPDGTFTLNNVAPGRYRMTVTPQGGAYAERALFAGTDALNEIVQVDSGDAPIQILIGSTEGRIEAVAEQAGTPFPNARVLLAPAARARLDLYRLATTDKNGKVVFSNVAPGAYKLFAWESMARATAYRNSRFLEQFEGNGRVVIVDRMGTVSPGQLPVLPAAQ